MRSHSSRIAKITVWLRALPEDFDLSTTDVHSIEPTGEAVQLMFEHAHGITMISMEIKRPEGHPAYLDDIARQDLSVSDHEGQRALAATGRFVGILPSNQIDQTRH